MLGLHLDLGKIRAYGSAYLASILYQTELGDFVYQKDGSSNMVLSNQASLGDTYDGLTYSGRGIELGATNDVDIPIHHTLGSDVYSSMSSPAGLTVLDPNISSAGGGSTNGGILYLETSAIDIDATCLVSMTVTNTTGTPYINGYHDGTTSVLFDTPVLVVDGIIEIEVENRLETRIQLYMNNTTIWSFDTATTIKQITNPNSYLTYYDFTDGLVTVDNSLNTPSTKYTLNTKTVNNFLTHTTPWSASDWTRINNNPNLIGKLAIETLGATKTIPELDMVMDAGASADSYYMCSEKSGAYLVDSRVAYGSNIITTSWYSGGTTLDTTIVGETIVFNSIGDAYYYNGIIAPNIGDILLIDFTVSGYTSGAVFVDGGRSAITSSVSANGDYSFLVKALDTGTTANRPIVRSFNSAGFVGTVSNLSIRLATATEIANYTSTVRTNADLQQKGLQTTAFVTDGAGVPISFTGNILNFDSNSYTDTQLNPSLAGNFWLEEVIGGIVYQHKYDGVNLTTYTDNVAGTPTAHSPENASYLLGKGVYPKVTADPYASYQAKTFQLWTGTQYTNYNQAARYTILAAL